VTASAERLRGFLRLLFLYDVAEAIDLQQLKQLLGPRGGEREPRFGRGTPEHIRFEVPPYVESAEPVRLSTGQTAACSLRYYSFAVIALQLELPFEGSWSDLVAEAWRWNGPTDLEREMRALVREHVDRAAAAITRPHKEWWLHETYLVVNVEQVSDSLGEAAPGHSLLAARRKEIAEIVWGEDRALSEPEVDEVCRASLSYYPADLIVISSSGAFVYDRAEEAIVATQVLEYAQLQLLELRYYDRVMSGVLAQLYDALEKERSLFGRWTLSREARRINRIRLDVAELAERIDNDIKFVSDVYYARVHRLAAARMGVSEYRELVDEKLRTAGELYEFMVDEFNEARSFVLEFAITILALLDVIYLIRGH